MCAKVVECVPNFSEGRDMAKIKEITDAAESSAGCMLLDVDPGKATNRTVVTLAGPPEAVMEGAFRAIKKASQIIDMRTHKGEHPRMGATDVCPFVPIANITMEECADLARQLGKRVGEELGISVYLYESAASKPERKNLANCRKGEYEAMAQKLKDPKWAPDFGPTELNARAGVTAIGARNFLVAYNVNLNTMSTRRANAVAFDIRENGRILREGDPVTGTIVKDEKGQPIRVPGSLKCCKAIGWYIDEYKSTQISINLTDISVTPVHVAFDEVCKKAGERGMRVTGSEIVGLCPKSVLIDAGKHYLMKQNRSTGISEEEIIHIAIRTFGLNELSKFDIRKRVIEYVLEDRVPAAPKLVDMSVKEFTKVTASEAPAPGGGSVAAVLGSLGASLSAMVANLSANKRGWDNRVDEFSAWAVKGQELRVKLLKLVDDDTLAFNEVMNAIKMPNDTADDKAKRAKAMDLANKNAANIPLTVMKTTFQVFEIAEAMAKNGNPASVSDAGVGALCTRSGIEGAYLNVKINMSGIDDLEYRAKMMKEADEILADAKKKEAEIMAIVHDVLARESMTPKAAADE